MTEDTAIPQATLAQQCIDATDGALYPVVAEALAFHPKLAQSFIEGQQYARTLRGYPEPMIVYIVNRRPNQNVTDLNTLGYYLPREAIKVVRALMPFRPALNPTDSDKVFAHADEYRRILNAAKSLHQGSERPETVELVAWETLRLLALTLAEELAMTTILEECRMIDGNDREIKHLTNQINRIREDSCRRLAAIDQLRNSWPVITTQFQHVVRRLIPANQHLAVLIHPEWLSEAVCADHLLAHIVWADQRLGHGPKGATTTLYRNTCADPWAFFKACGEENLPQVMLQGTAAAKSPADRHECLTHLAQSLSHGGLPTTFVVLTTELIWRELTEQNPGLLQRISSVTSLVPSQPVEFPL